MDVFVEVLISKKLPDVECMQQHASVGLLGPLIPCLLCNRPPQRSRPAEEPKSMFYCHKLTERLARFVVGNATKRSRIVVGLPLNFRYHVRNEWMRT